MVTADKLLKIEPTLGKRAERVASDLNKIMHLAKITDPKTQAMFIAQVLHETKGTRVPLKENGDSTYFTEMYDVRSSNENRRKAAKENGNTEPGDGEQYFGQGYLQLTWKNNYRNVSEYVGVNLVSKPQLASNPEVAIRTAVKVWQGINARGVNLNDYVKTGSEDEFLKVSIGINGKNKKTGLPNGYEDRLQLWNKAKKVLEIK